MHLPALKTLYVMCFFKFLFYSDHNTNPVRGFEERRSLRLAADKYDSLAKQGEDKSGGSLHLVTPALCGESSGGCELRG